MYVHAFAVDTSSKQAIFTTGGAILKPRLSYVVLTGIHGVVCILNEIQAYVTTPTVTLCGLKKYLVFKESS